MEGENVTSANEAPARTCCWLHTAQAKPLQAIPGNGKLAVDVLAG